MSWSVEKSRIVHEDRWIRVRADDCRATSSPSTIKTKSSWYASTGMPYEA